MHVERIEGSHAFEVWDVRGGEAPVLFSCEHAAVELPAGWAWDADDAWLVGTHWSYDIGAADLALACAATFGAPAVLSQFSRLLIDPNRPLDSETLFRSIADGREIVLNRTLSDDDRAARIARCYQPYHDRLDAAVAARRDAALVSVHSFTPVYEGQARVLEVGVLFDVDEALGVAVARHLADAGLRTELNAPWSGRAGLMYCAQHHASAHGRPTIELEIRQDLASSPAWRARFAQALKRALEASL